MLVTDAHGGFGGISQYNRDVLEALSLCDHVSEVLVLPRIIREQLTETPSNIIYDQAASRGRYAYVRRSLAVGLFGARFDLILCGHINLLPIATVVARVRRIPILLFIHGIEAWNPPGKLATYCAPREPSCIISVSEITVKRFQAWTKSWSSGFTIVPPTFSDVLFSPSGKKATLLQRYGLLGRQVIMTLGRMAEKERCKGFDEVIEALPQLCKIHPDITYLVVGDGPDRSRLEEKVKKLGLVGHVVFAGHIDDSEKADHYRVADVFVMPSSGEGFGIVILEALACGIPVVASQVDGTYEALRGGRLGLTVDPKDKGGLVSATLTALTSKKKVPHGLAYFSFERFRQRLESAILPVGDQPQ